MGRSHDGIDDALASWIGRQHVFFVATAPVAPHGHLNCSPKGLDSLAVLDRHRVAYLDYVGSGVETIAHLRENGRIVLMLCAFDGPPRIVRLHGAGHVVERDDRDFEELSACFAAHPGARAVIDVHVERVSESCGFGVPHMRFEAERTQLRDWVARKGDTGLDAYRREHNATSVDGLPGLRGKAGALSERRTG